MKDKPIRLDNWSTCDYPNSRYIAPECRQTCLQGFVFGHPGFKDGDHVVTSPIDKIHGRIIVTRSGKVYNLGRIDPKFRKVLKEKNYNYDYRNPIKIAQRKRTF